MGRGMSRAAGHPDPWSSTALDSGLKGPGVRKAVAAPPLLGGVANSPLTCNPLLGSPANSERKTPLQS